MAVGRPRAPRLRRADDAITPVVGTSLILVITVLGMAGVLFWGTPTLQGIQDRGSVVGMEGEFDELRRASRELSVPDASRVPTVVLEDGDLSLEAGTRMMVAVALDTAYMDCDFSVTGWETSQSTELFVDLTGCREAGNFLTWCVVGDCLEIHKVTGSSTIEQGDISWSNQGGNVYRGRYTGSDLDFDFADDDWLVRATDGASTPTVYAEAWILEQKRITWRLSTSVTDVQLHLEGGAVFEVEDGSYFLYRSAAIREDAFGSNDHVLRLVTLLGTETGSSGRGTPEVFMGLVGNHVRTSTEQATQIRYAFHGDIAEAWCQSLLIRNGALDPSADPLREYTPDGACTDTTPHVLYRITDSVTGRETFPFEFLHARVTSSIRA